MVLFLFQIIYVIIALIISLSVPELWKYCTDIFFAPLSFNLSISSFTVSQNSSSV